MSSRARSESDGANTAATVFYARRGNVVNTDAGSIIKARRGLFALVVAIEDGAVMLSAERSAPDVPELPGGGVEEGGTAGWESIASLPGLSINRAHWCAIPTLLSGLAVERDAQTDLLFMSV